MRPLRPAALLAALLAAAAPTASALDLAAMTDAERAAFGEEVRAFLMANPEVLVDAIGVLEAREAEAAAAADAAAVLANLDAIQADGHSWVGGNPDGDVTVVEFMDYRCGYCRRAGPEVAALVAGDPGVRLVVKEFPILGPESELASRFAIATLQVHGEDAYEAVHDGLMAMESEVSADTLGRLAEALAIDAAPVLARMDAPEVTAAIDANRALAQRLGISGTPTFVVGDQMVRGFVAASALEAIVEKERDGL